MEEIKQAIVDRPEPHPNFVNAVAEVVSLRTSQLVPEQSEAGEGGTAFDESFRIGLSEIFEPVPDGNFSVFFLIEDNVAGRHGTSTELSHRCDRPGQRNERADVKVWAADGNALRRDISQTVSCREFHMTPSSISSSIFCWLAGSYRKNRRRDELGRMVSGCDEPFPQEFGDGQKIHFEIGCAFESRNTTIKLNNEFDESPNPRSFHHCDEIRACFWGV